MWFCREPERSNRVAKGWVSCFVFLWCCCWYWLRGFQTESIERKKKKDVRERRRKPQPNNHTRTWDDIGSSQPQFSTILNKQSPSFFFSPLHFWSHPHGSLWFNTRRYIYIYIYTHIHSHLFQIFFLRFSLIYISFISFFLRIAALELLLLLLLCAFFGLFS